METPWECIVVGGGAAGLSAALVLGRARRRTLLVDSGEQSNLVAAGIGGVLGHDGRPPAELYAIGRRELETYPSVAHRAGVVVGGDLRDDLFLVELADGSREAAERLLLASGMEYVVPALPGARDFWGATVFHCPFCHGWEVRDRPLAVLDDGPTGVHRALLLRGWSDDVVLLTGGPSELSRQEVLTLSDAGVEIDERPIAALEGEGRELSAVVFESGSRRPCAGLLVAAPLRQRSDLAARFGVSTREPGPGAIDSVAVDPLTRTNVPGIFAAGDLSAQMPQFASAVASGSLAAAAVVQSLLVDRSGMPGSAR